MGMETGIRGLGEMLLELEGILASEEIALY